jgi:transposase
MTHTKGPRRKGLVDSALRPETALAGCRIHSALWLGQSLAMATFVPFSRDESFLLPPDLRDWLPEDDLAHFIVAAVERVPLDAFQAKAVASGKAQYHPRLMLALLVYCYANGIFSSRRIERATFRDSGVRYVAASLHPDHDTIAAFRRSNRAAFEAAFLRVLLLAREAGLLRVGTARSTGRRSMRTPPRYARCATTGRASCAPSSRPTSPP